jgi:Zn-dependent protease
VRAMSAGVLASGLILYLCFIIALSFHEFAHAWMASRCGDNTAKALGRLTVNPLAHIDPLGTVILPLLMIFMPAMGAAGATFSNFVIGWAKPVPVDPRNYRNGVRDDNLVSVAGPISNLILAFATLIVFKIAIASFGQGHDFANGFTEFLLNLVYINILLAWFNMIPIPPLDGSHLLKNFTRMSYQTYFWLSQWGIWILILALNFTPLRYILKMLISKTLYGMAIILRL